MGKSFQRDHIVLLFDNYGQESQALHTSFKMAGYDYPAVVIESNGFFPEDVTSVYEFFLGDFKNAPNAPGHPRYFNQVPVPKYWEISGNNTKGSIHNLNKKRGGIFYAEPGHKRLVKVVDWYDENGIVRVSDHYNRYGALFGRTAFNAKGQRVNKTYFSPEGREVIVENFVTGDIILNYDNQVRLFYSKVEFVLFFMKAAGYEQRHIYYNSLSTPFFVSQRMDMSYPGDILFWQEPIRDDIPGNMKIIFQRMQTRTTAVKVQKKASYDRMNALGVPEDMVSQMGYIYPFQKENRHRPEILICTNSDNIEQLANVVEDLPQMHFHIAALTEMSSKLMAFGSYDNVSIYPGVKMDVLDDLFMECDWYLDINHEAEIVSAVRRAFLHNQLILGFAETLHNREYIAEEHIYAAADYSQMISEISIMQLNPVMMDSHLQLQHDAALAETVENMRSMLAGE